MSRAGPFIVSIVAWLGAGVPTVARAEPSRAGALERLGVDGDRLHASLGDSVIVAFPGDLQLVLGHLGALALGPVDPDVDATLDAEEALWVRLRLSPSVTLLAPALGPLPLVRLAAEVDVLRDWAAVGSGRDAISADPRARAETGLVGQRLSQLYLAAAGPHLQVQLGLVRSRWGLGLVSNAGDDVELDGLESPFGWSLQGDHVVRAGLSLTPLGPASEADPTTPPLTAALAVDGVVDDDTASWSGGDRAYQMVAAISGHTGIFRGGLYVAHRWQSHGEGGDTTVTVIDGTLRLLLADEPGLRASLEAEVATIRGSSSLAQSVTQPGSFDVDQLGGILRFGIVSGPFTGVLEVGAGSADDNPFDDELRAFALDRDHRVGLILFREALRAHAAMTADNIADPDYRGEPPRGYARTATLGAVRGASYANPRVTFALLDGDLHLMGGFLYAASDGEYVDPFWSGIAGGAPRGPRNGPPARDLGWEIDLGASLRVDLAPLELRLRLEGAYASLGDVFASSSGAAAGEVWGVWTHVGLLW